MAVTAHRRVGLRSPLQPVITTAESWQDHGKNRIRVTFGKLTTHAVGLETISGAISQRLFGLKQRVTGDSNGFNIITQSFLPIRQSASGAMEAFGSMSGMRMQRLTIDPRGYVSARGPAAMTFQRIIIPRMDGVVSGVLGQSHMNFAPMRQSAAGFSDLGGAIAMRLKSMQQIADYFGGMGGITVTPRANNTIFQTLFPISQSVIAHTNIFGSVAVTLPRLQTRADAYTNVFASAAMTMRSFSTSPQAQIVGSMSQVFTGSIDSFTMRPIRIIGSLFIVNDGAIRMTLFPPTQQVNGWGSAVGAGSTLLFHITESGNLGDVMNGTAAQTLFGIASTGLMGMESYGSAAQTLFPVTQQALGNLPAYGPAAQTLFPMRQSLSDSSGGSPSTDLTWDLTAQASLANGERSLNIAGRGIADVLIGLALQGTFG